MPESLMPSDGRFIPDKRDAQALEAFRFRLGCREWPTGARQPRR